VEPLARPQDTHPVRSSQIKSESEKKTKPQITRPGKHTKNDGKSPFSMGKSTNEMAI